MRVCCDTNIIVSGLLFGGPPRDVMRLVADSTLVNVSSAAMFEAFERVVARPRFRLNTARVAAMLNQAAETFEFAPPVARRDVLPRDRDDNRLLEAAVAGAARVVISGDRDLLGLGSFRELPILSAADFLRRFPATSAKRD